MNIRYCVDLTGNERAELSQMLSAGKQAHVKVRQYPDATLAVFHGPRLLARYTKEGNLIEPNGLKAAA